MDLSPAGQSAIEAIDYIALHEPTLHERSPPFRKAAFNELTTLAERATLLHLMEDCPLPDEVSTAQMIRARAHAKAGIDFRSLHPDLSRIWFAHDLKFYLGFGISLDAASRRKVETWFHTGLFLAHRLLSPVSRPN